MPIDARLAEAVEKEAFASVSAGHPNDWLLSVEIAELAKKEGYIDISYKAISLDDEGFPLIPDKCLPAWDE